MRILPTIPKFSSHFHLAWQQSTPNSTEVIGIIEDAAKQATDGFTGDGGVSIHYQTETPHWISTYFNGSPVMDRAQLLQHGTERLSARVSIHDSLDKRFADNLRKLGYKGELTYSATAGKGSPTVDYSRHPYLPK